MVEKCPLARMYKRPFLYQSTKSTTIGKNLQPGIPRVQRVWSGQREFVVVRMSVSLRSLRFSA